MGKPLETGTPPFQIQINENNIPHIIDSNVTLKGKRKQEHLKAIKYLEDILKASSKVDEQPVDLTHNKSEKTIEHKENVDKYVYFEGYVKVGEDYYNVRFVSERVKGQDPNLLNLYNVHIKREALQDSTDRPSYNSNIAPFETDVNRPLSQKGEKIKGSFDRLTKSIKITKEADFSTYQHEFAHFWLDNIWDYVNSGKASEEYIKQFNELKKWLGVKPNQNYFTRAQLI